MGFHNLLQKQINKHLPEDCTSNPHFKNFIQAVNDSYLSYERDKELMNHAFSQSEEEYNQLNQDITNEYKLKKESIEKLYNSLRILDPNIENIPTEDLGILTEYFSQQIKKTKEAEDELSKQIHFQELLMNIASGYINVPLSEIDDRINLSLKKISEYVQADRAYVFGYDFEKNTCTKIYQFLSEKEKSKLKFKKEFPIHAFQTFVEKHKKGESVIINDVSVFQDVDLRNLLMSNNVKSIIAIPMMINNQCVGFVSFDSANKPQSFTEKEKKLLELFSTVLASIRTRFLLDSELNRTLELLKTLLANLQYGILVEDEHRRILFSNHLFSQMFKIPLSPEQMEGMDCKDSAEQSKHLFADEDFFVKRIFQTLEKREVVTNELIETKEGKFYERDYIPIYIQEEYRGHLWKYNDITERVITRNLLQQSEERNRLIMESAINAIITANCEGEITFWNKSAEQIFGWKKEEVIGKLLSDTIIPEIHRENHKKGMDHYIKTGYGPVLNKQIELPALKKSGEEFLVEISIIPLEQEGKKFFCSFIKDISERKRAENNLKFQEEKYRNIIANMNLGLLEVDNNEIIQYANQSFCDLSGFDPQEIVGKNPSNLWLYKENDLTLIKNQIQLRKEGISALYQIPIKNKRGELRWWAISGAPNYDDKGELKGSIGIHLDITDQKKLEEELKKEKENAQEASKAKEAFLANMSHEIRTPLNAIIGFLRELNKQKLTTTQEEFVKNSTIASQHLLAIINNILDISKIEAGEMSLEKKEFSIQNSIKNTIGVLQSKANQKNISLFSKIDDQIAQVLKGDSLKIEQILYNLIGNALKFTSEGQIKVECNLLKDDFLEQKIQILVSDTGIGMSKEFVNNIYKKFYQEDETIARQFGGTGLGMAITRELIKLMDGKITIESEKNIGTEVAITLTLQKGSQEKNQTVENNSNFSIKGTKILLVEDNELNRLVAQNSLNYFQCEVKEAENGLEALEILKKETFDVILMDIQMPMLDGIETTKRIREKHQLNTPIIALTANAFKSEIENCKRAGMNDYLTKPFVEQELKKIIYKYTKNAETDLTQSHKSKQPLLYNLHSITTLSRGNEEFVKKMVSIFITQTQEILPKINTAILEKDNQEIAKLAHKIKPSIESLAIHSILEDVKELEYSARNQSVDHQAMIKKFQKIKKTLKKVIQELQKDSR